MGIIDDIKKHGKVFEYNPEKFWKENTIGSIWKELMEIEEDERKLREKTGYKPEYFITVWEAKMANLHWIKWLSESYKLIGGWEAVNTIRQREIIINYDKKELWKTKL